MSKFSLRPIEVHELPLPKNVEALHPERVILRYDRHHTVDVGSLCYSRRESRKNLPNKGRQVDLDSCTDILIERTRTLIRYLSDQVALSGKRPKTLCAEAHYFTGLFMSWADANGYPNIFTDEDAARKGFRQHIDFLKERIRLNRLSLNTGARYQWIVLRLLQHLVEIDDLARGVNLIRADEKATEATKPPCENAQSKMLALCQSIFLGLSQLVLENQPYPYRMSMPKYLAFPDDCLWVFPTTRWCMPPHLLAKQEHLGRSGWGFDYANGKLADLEEIKHHYYNVHNAGWALNFAKELLDRANNDPYEYRRRQTAKIAQNAFLVLFVANTGMNKSQVLELLWDSEYEVHTERQGFKTIKWRASGKVCHFELTTDFMPFFKLYLRLRAYILNEVKSEYLFFTLGRQLDKKPRPMAPSVFHAIHTSFRTIDPTLVHISFREWRAAKCDWLIRNVDVSTAALILQNSEKTVLKNYSAGSETLHMEEMSTYFTKVTETVVNRGVKIEHGTVQSVGLCSDFGHPHSITEQAPVPPNCHRAEGCLFCNKYKVHADEVDTRKLLSCRHCLYQSAHLAPTEEHHQRMFAPIFSRIGEILTEIDSRDPGLVEKIRIEVEEEGELAPYWAGKLEMMVSLGMVG